MNTQKLFDIIYTFIEKYFYLIVGVIVIALVSLTASLYAQDVPQKASDSSNFKLKPEEVKTIQYKLYKSNFDQNINKTVDKTGWSKVAKRYKMEVRSAKPKLT